MRLPGGAVCPAMNPTTGFFTFALIHSGGFFFCAAADFADHHDRFGFRVVVEHFEHVDELESDAPDRRRCRRKSTAPCRAA